MTFLAVGNAPDTAYVITRNGSDKDGIYEFDLTSKSLGKLAVEFVGAKAFNERQLREGIARQIRTIEESGGNPCPPIIVGLLNSTGKRNLLTRRIRRFDSVTLSLTTV